MIWTVLLIGLGSLFLIGYLSVKKKLRYWKERGAPYIEPSMGMLKNPLTYLTDVYVDLKTRLAPFGGIYFLTTPTVLVVDLDLAAAILVKDFQYFDERYAYSSSENDLSSGGVAFAMGQLWKTLRRNAGPLFTSKNLKIFHNNVLNCTEEIHKKLITTGQVDKETNVSDVVNEYVIETNGNILFGTTFSVIKKQMEFKTLLHEFKNIVFQVVKFSSFAIFYPKLCRFFNIKVVSTKHAELFRNHIRKSLQEKQENGSEETDVVGLLLKIQNTEILTFGEISGYILTFYGTQLHLLNSALTYAIFELAINQDIQDRAREEITKCLEKYDGNCTYDACMEMKYIDQIVQEIFRKYPAVTTLTRICKKDYEVAGTGLIIEKGTPLIIPIYAIHHDPEIYPDPKKFDPERFAKDSIESRHPYAWIPFGGGPKFCIGKRFSMMQLTIGLVSFLSKYRISPRPGTSLNFDPRYLILTHKENLWLNFEKV